MCARTDIVFFPTLHVRLLVANCADECGKTDTQKDRETDRQTVWQIDILTDRQTV